MTDLTDTTADTEFLPDADVILDDLDDSPPPPPVDDESDDAQDDDDDQEPTGRAARMRVRAQQAEAERDAATAMVDTLRRAEAERVAAGKLAVVADLWEYGGVTPADLADDTGLIDPAKVAAALDALLECRPGLAAAALRKPTPGTYANQGQHQPVQQSGRRKASFADLF